MSYTKGQRVQSQDGKRRGTCAQDADAHRSALVLWDGDESPRWELPECVTLQEKQPGTGVRDAWIRGETRLQKASKR